MARTTSWGDVLVAAADLGGRVQERFDRYGLGLLATVRSDGSPRLSGIEPLFALDEIWLGMMGGSHKARDLQLDPRFALHTAGIDKMVQDGDAKIYGRAIEVTDPAVIDTWLGALTAAVGHPPPPGPLHLFRIDVGKVEFLQPGEDVLVIEWWTPDEGHRRVERA